MKNQTPSLYLNPAAPGSILNGRYLAPPEDKDGRRWVRTSALVQAPPKISIGDGAMWNPLRVGRKQISQVTRTRDTTSHWIMGVGDKTFEWDSEVLADEPGKRIAWRSIAGDSDNAGEVIFESAPGGHGTTVTVLQEFKLGKFANAWETLVGRNPKQAVIENLRHFKALAETGEIPRAEGQPHGPRGAIGGMKKSLYGENIETPQGNDRKAS